MVAWSRVQSHTFLRLQSLYLFYWIFLQWLGEEWMAHEARSNGSKWISIKRQKKKAPIGAHLQKNHISDPNDLLIIVQLWHAELRITWHTNHLVHKKRTGNAFIYVPLVIDKAYVLATKFLLMHCLFEKQESAAHLCRNQIHGSMKQHEDNPPLFLQLKTRGCQNLHYTVTKVAA